MLGFTAECRINNQCYNVSLVQRLADTKLDKLIEAYGPELDFCPRLKNDDIAFIF